MKAISLRNILLQNSFALVCFVGGMVVFAVEAKAQVAGKNYLVTITQVGGGETQACFQFDNTNTLVIDGAPVQFTFGPTSPEGTNPYRWQAVSRGPSDTSVGLSGEERPGPFGAGSQLRNGNGINQLGNRYTFSGNQTDTCPQFFTTEDGPTGGAVLFR